jgi:hypothetical protein
LKGHELKLKDLKKSTSPFKIFINKEVPMLVYIARYYKKSDGNTKRKILGCIFSKKPFWKQGELQPLSSQLRYRFYSTPAWFSKNRAQKKVVENNLLSYVAPLNPLQKEGIYFSR